MNHATALSNPVPDQDLQLAQRRLLGDLARLLARCFAPRHFVLLVFNDPEQVDRLDHASNADRRATAAALRRLAREIDPEGGR